MYGPDNFNVPIAIYHQEEHFYGVRNAGSLHRKDNKYCFACLVPYRHAKDHNKACKARCANCGLVFFFGISLIFCGSIEGLALAGHALPKLDLPTSNVRIATASTAMQIATTTTKEAMSVNEQSAARIAGSCGA
jgi:hypothetical protein